jgi:hypothetical protein
VKTRSIETSKPKSEYPGQLWILQRREDGFIRTFGVFTKPPTKDEILADYGQYPWTLKRTKPRFAVEWKITKEEVHQQKETRSSQPNELASLESTTRNLKIGVVGLGIGSVVGWGLSAWNFANHGERLNRLELLAEAQLGTHPSSSFVCPTCQKPLYNPFRSFCSGCGTRLVWGDKLQTANPSQMRCPYCTSPVEPADSFCVECGRNIRSKTGVTFWSLP